MDFFKEKGHAILPSASLIPENDPTVLFTTAGMQPLVPYLLGQDHPMGKRLANAQKCLRTDDIDEVGDNRHLTFFEMLGNWSLGDYFKEESIQWSYEFLTGDKWLAMDPERLYVSVFEGDADAPRDNDSINMWQAQFAVHGMAAEVGQPGRDWPTGETHGKRIFPYPKKSNWWGPAGQTGPCGPDTEIYYDTRREHDPAFGDICHPACDCGRFVEIWNNVFMQYNKRDDGSYEPLTQRNVDTGMGLERMAAVLQGCATVFDTDKMQNIIQVLKQVFGLEYGLTDGQDKSIRIIADHLRAAVFLIGDARGVVPSNIGQGYIVRRLIRRSVREAKRLGVEVLITPAVCQAVIEQYKDEYTELEQNAARILDEVKKEEEKFNSTLEKGLKEFDKMAEQAPKITGEQAFVLYATYGFPIELTEELAKERGGSVDRGVFDEEFKKHQALSRTASAGTFKGGLADHTEQTTRLHTATHLLHQALRAVLGPHVEQRGSNITEQRLRFDFTHGQKMTDQEKLEVEAMVNEVIKRDLPVVKEEMSVEQAKQTGAIGLFESKYGEKVSVYTVLDTENPKGFYSKEICGGPHVAKTGELGGFKISKEEAVSSGVRRIKAVLG